MSRIALLARLHTDADESALISRDLAPRHDYTELGRALGADLIDRGWLERDDDPVVRNARERLGLAGAAAIWAFRHRYEYDVFFSGAERVGLPLAALLKAARARTGHVMLAHWLTPPKKGLPLRLGRLHTHIDRIVCWIELQRRVGERLGVPPEKLAVVARGTDECFWRPLPDVAVEPIVASAGLERRDYPTLLRALADCPFSAVLAAASPFFDRGGIDQALPANVTVEGFDYSGLRNLYARSRFVVIPLVDVDFQAGITAVVEAMAMGKAVVLTRTSGMASAGLIRDGEHGLYVRPGDHRALRDAMTRLFENPAEAERMGRAARKAIEDRMTLRHLIDGLAAEIRAAAAMRSARDATYGA